MSLRFVTPSIHAFLDYPVAISLMAAPFVLSLGTSSPMAFWLALGTGIAAFILTVFTDHKLGMIRVLPYSLHLAVDLAVGLIFIAAPFLFGFSGIDAWSMKSWNLMVAPDRQGRARWSSRLAYAGL